MDEMESIFERGIVAIKKDGEYQYIYSNFDNHLKCLGMTLNTYYTSTNEVQQLIDLGALYSIGTTITNNCPTIKDWLALPQQERGVIAYFRDQHLTEISTTWEIVKPLTTDDIREVCCEYYTYIFDTSTTTWKVAMQKSYNNPNGPIFYNLNSLLNSTTLQAQFLAGK